jgi:hypothetical protein
MESSGTIFSEIRVFIFTERWYEYCESGYSIGVGDWNKSSIGWLRRDRLHAAIVCEPFPAFHVVGIRSIAGIMRSGIECVKDLCTYIKASMSGRIATKPANSALFIPRTGAIRAKGMAKCRTSSGIYSDSDILP